MRQMLHGLCPGVAKPASIKNIAQFYWVKRVNVSLSCTWRPPASISGRQEMFYYLDLVQAVEHAIECPFPVTWD